MPGLALTSVVTSNPDRAAEARARHPTASIVPSPDLLLSEADAHDLVPLALIAIRFGGIQADDLRRDRMTELALERCGLRKVANARPRSVVQRRRLREPYPGLRKMIRSSRRNSASMPLCLARLVT